MTRHPCFLGLSAATLWVRDSHPISGSHILARFSSARSFLSRRSATRCSSADILFLSTGESSDWSAIFSTNFYGLISGEFTNAFSWIRSLFWIRERGVLWSAFFCQLNLDRLLHAHDHPRTGDLRKKSGLPTAGRAARLRGRGGAEAAPAYPGWREPKGRAVPIAYVHIPRVVRLSFAIGI